jgi:exonuclease III
MWSISAYDGVPVHFISVYIPPAENIRAQSLCDTVQWIVKNRILKIDPKAKVVVMGDINTHAKKLKFLESCGISPLIDDKTATHVLGN